MFSCMILHICVHAQSCLTLCNPTAIAHQAPLSMGLSQQEYQSGFIREMQIKTIMRSHLTPVRSLQTINARQGVEIREPSYTVGGNTNQYSHYGEQCGDSLKNWKQNCHMTQQSHFWAYTPRKPELKDTREPQCSSQHCLQQPGHGRNLDVHRQMNG